MNTTLVPERMPQKKDTGTSKVRVLVIDDDPLCMSLCKRYLSRPGRYEFDVSSAPSGEEAIRRLATEDFDCLLVDYYLPDLTGTQVLQRIQTDAKDDAPPAIILTANGGEKAAISAVRSGATDFLPKRALSVGSLTRAITNAVDNSRLQQSIAARSRELKVANEKLQFRNEEISNFYQSVSHEVKTPLAAVREFIAIVRDGIVGPVTGEQMEILDHALDGCDQITSHFNELVEMTRLAARKISINRTETELSSVIIQCRAGVANAISAKTLTLETSIDDSVPSVFVDRNRINQVVSNLLGNAIKYTNPGGRISVAVTYDERADVARIVVADTGCGIAAEHLDRIYERLYQVDGIGDESMGAGLGLGLSITKEIVALHGGAINVESTLGEGSTFTVLIPREDTGLENRRERCEESITN